LEEASGVKVVRGDEGEAPGAVIIRVPEGEGAIAEPRPELGESSNYGPLPRIGPDGTRPSALYAHPPVATDGRPIISILVGGVGLSESVTAAALNLPTPVSLAFAPYGRNLERDAGRA